MAYKTRKMAQNAGNDIDNLVDLLVKNAVRRRVPLKHAVADFKQAYLEKALEMQGGNPSRAAEVLGVNRHTLARQMKTVSTGRV
jgi:DNA-binding NtrC family response regulator